MREIDAAEYDAAALRAPHECPLLAMGDLRSGRQLLEDFHADGRLTVARMSESRRGSPQLRRLAAAVAELAGRLEAYAAEAEAATESTGLSILSSKAAASRAKRRRQQ